MKTTIFFLLYPKFRTFSRGIIGIELILKSYDGGDVWRKLDEEKGITQRLPPFPPPIRQYSP
jgi:hypothetical protein